MSYKPEAEQVAYESKFLMEKLPKGIKLVNSFSRRQFISNSLAASAGVSFLSVLPRARANMGSPNEAIQLGIIGLGSKAGGHIRQLLGMKGVRIVALCDVDPANLAKGTKLLKERMGLFSVSFY